MLWDRLTRTEVKPERLFSARSDVEKLIHLPFCLTLDGERAKRRGTSGGATDGCPKLAQLGVMPADSNANRRFDRFRLVAPHGVAGGFAEGRYDIAIPVTAAMRAAIKPAYRSSFEVQPQ